MAFVSDNRPGRVYAVDVPSRRLLWSSSVGGRPGPLLEQDGALWVSLYDAGALAAIDPATGRLLYTRPACTGPGQLASWQGAVWTACAAGGAVSAAGRSLPGPAGFGLAASGDSLWGAAYSAGELVRLDAPGSARLPAGLHPFWLAAGGSGSILAAAEGASEDSDPGAVYRLGGGGALDLLLAARDPDQVVEAGGSVYVAADGEKAVLALRGGEPPKRLLAGADPVALAVDPRLGLLLVLTDARE